jgi:UDP-N-acetylmuramoyl-L-alanyl-D-glutamate--2,6-diaminopimelate ligase
MLAEESVPEKPEPKAAIVNADDASAPFFLDCASGALHWSYALDHAADVRAHDLEVSGEGTRFRMVTPKGEASVLLSLPGRFNVANALAAASIGLSQGLDLETVRKGLESVTSVFGRMERIDEGQPFAVVVDYAHTEHGLTTVLTSLRPSVEGRIIVVFGAIGGRDRPRRFGLGRAAASHADVAILTNEDPKFEDPFDILRDIAGPLEEAGWREGERYHLIADRRAAIEAGFRLAQPGDLVLLAGKGHEPSIVVRDESIPWNEPEEARRALRGLVSNPPG